MSTARVVIENLGPFEYAEIELRPLTIFVGRNSVGKSFLAYLLWSLMVSVPDFDTLLDVISRSGGFELAKKILESVESGRNPERDFKELVRLFIEVFPKAITIGITRTLQKVFTVDYRDLIRLGAESGRILVEGPHALLEIELSKSEVRPLRYRPNTEFIDKLEVDVPRPGRLRVSYEKQVVIDDPVLSIVDLDKYIGGLLGLYVRESFGLFRTETSTAILPDSRAGITRTLLKPHLPDVVTETLSYVDSYYVELYYKLAEDASRQLIDLDLVNPLLNELGCQLEIRFEGGIYPSLYIKTWSGKYLPLRLAPSGIREVATTVLALASQREPHVIVIEEPEAHLHPRAQHVLTRIIVKAINKLKKTIILTTHSDIILYSLENLVMASTLGEKIKELGLSESEIIDSSKVAVYLIRIDRTKAVAERLTVTSEGIPKEEFAKVTEELADERAKILLLSEKRASLSQQS